MRIIAAVLCVLAFFPAQAAYSITSEKYFEHTKELPHETRYMTGDWSDTRTELSDKGVTFASSFVCDILGNATGGNEQGARYDSSMGWDINFDLEKMVGMIGTQFHVSGLWRAGQNLSKATIGNDIVCSSIFGSEQFRFYFLYLEKTFLDKRVNIRVGRIAAGDDFAFSPLYWTFVSNGIDGCPITIPINMFFTVYPTATWGARAKVNLFGDFNMQSGIYDGDDRVQRLSAYGLDFSLRLKKGIAFAHELSYNPTAVSGVKGMAGNYKAGIYYNGETCRELYSDINGNSAAISGLDKKKHIGNYNVYFHVDQMIYKENKKDDQGLTPLFAAVVGPQNINKFPFFIMSGLIYKGLIPGFDNDVTACQVMWARYSDQLRRSQVESGQDPQRYELVLEFTHKINITPWMYLQPDMQYIINPGGTGTIKNAYVIGTRFGIVF